MNANVKRIISAVAGFLGIVLIISAAGQSIPLLGMSIPAQFYVAAAYIAGGVLLWGNPGGKAKS